jgi:hypothetical protein
MERPGAGRGSGPFLPRHANASHGGSERCAPGSLPVSFEKICARARSNQHRHGVAVLAGLHRLRPEQRDGDSLTRNNDEQRTGKDTRTTVAEGGAIPGP